VRIEPETNLSLEVGHYMLTSFKADQLLGGQNKESNISSAIVFC